MDTRREIITISEEETMRWAEELGRSAGPGDVYALSGELGTGKTILAKGMARGLGITDEVTSPTFTLLEIYSPAVPGGITLYHFDLYRIERDAEFDHLCFEEYWENEGVSIIEWAERAGNRLPDNAVRVRIEYLDANRRRIILEAPPALSAEGGNRP
jgi:tRNA threonylcarbamoyladenosine biosynthesis protein TsaE